MKKYIFVFLIVCVQLSLSAQKKDKVLFKINEEPTYVSEFKKLFETDKAGLNTNNFEENFELMVNYKLKLNQAKVEKIDTLCSLKNEFKTYKKSIVSSYIADDETLKGLLEEAYERSLNQVKASHLLILAQTKDTVKAYQKITDIKKQLDNGADFTEMAVKYSEDKSVVNNKGSLGSFSAFQMVYPFESAAFNTPVGQVSDIVRTRFGFHLIKVEEKSKIGKKINVAHIMVAGSDTTKKTKIDTIYNKLLAGSKFEGLAKRFSEDKGTSRKGGKLKPIAKGALPKSFEDVAFSLKEPNSFSKPFKTQYGWHIVKYYGTEEVKSFEEMKKELKRKIMNDQRKEVVEDVAYKKIEEKHVITTNQDALSVFKSKNPYSISKDSLKTVLLTINQEQYLQKDFANYINSRRTKKPLELYKDFKRSKLKAYITEHLEDENKDLKETLTTYKNGLVIFELMKNHVWDVPAKEKEKVETYYESNKAKYKEKGATFKEVKGYVESDYQEKIEKEWLLALRDANQIKYNKRQIKKLRKTYR